jgi:hypothetical protein
MFGSGLGLNMCREFIVLIINVRFTDMENSRSEWTIVK